MQSRALLYILKNIFKLCDVNHCLLVDNSYYFQRQTKKLEKEETTSEGKVIWSECDAHILHMELFLCLSPQPTSFNTSYVNLKNWLGTRLWFWSSVSHLHLSKNAFFSFSFSLAVWPLRLLWLSSLLHSWHAETLDRYAPCTVNHWASWGLLSAQTWVGAGSPLFWLLFFFFWLKAPTLHAEKSSNH